MRIWEPGSNSTHLGAVEVPEDAYYGAQTLRAAENFPVSGRTFGRPS